MKSYTVIMVRKGGLKAVSEFHGKNAEARAHAAYAAEAADRKNVFVGLFDDDDEDGAPIKSAMPL